jgi:hypothetical protein
MSLIDTPGPMDISDVDKIAACLSHLAATDQTRFLSQTVQNSRKTCTWIMRHRQYTTWHESDESSLLWLTARSGCGKTTVAAHVYDTLSLEQNINDQKPLSHLSKPVVLQFFFRKSNQESERNALAALRTFTAQLVRQEDRALRVLLGRHHQLSTKGAFEWSWESLTSVLDEMLKQLLPGLPIYIIIDAVDECESESRILILDWIKELVRKTSYSFSQTPAPAFKLFVTSRPEGDIIDQLYGFPMLSMTDADTASDMQALIHKRMEQFAARRHLAPEVTQSVARFLEANNKGMFIWVVLVLEELDRRDERLSNEAIASKLSRIPLTLVDTYEALLQKIPVHRRTDFWRIIRWLLYASRSLTVVELEAGLCLETATSSWHGFAGDLEFLCGSFFRFDGPLEEISYVHQTARTFLEAHIQRADPANFLGLEMSSVAAHEDLATVCVQYLLREDMAKGLRRVLESVIDYSTYSDTIRTTLRQNPFLSYAIESWAVHIRALKTPSPALATMLRRLLSSFEHRVCILTLTFFIKQHGSPNVPNDETPVHFAAYFNLPFLLDSYILQDGISVNAVADTGDTPLVWASEMGNVDCVRRLLQLGANPNQFEYDGWSALHWAARNGHINVASTLLGYGAQVDPRDTGGNTPLDWALDRGFWNVADLLRQQASNDQDGSTEHASDDDDAECSNTRAARSARAWKLWDYRP